ncbi:MAG: hypothetical protein HY393_04205 [Candidatus Diapherotrites archaeon]|nr:hypothetical protein [Candidatus Diapherotrites archaeon]
MNAKGQIGFEYLVLTGFLLLIIALVFAYSFVSYSQAIQSQKAEASLNAIVGASDYVYGRGNGNTLLVDIEVPEGVSSFQVLDNIVSMRVSGAFGSSDYLRTSKAAFVPASLSTSSGPRTLKVEAVDANVRVTGV